MMTTAILPLAILELWLTPIWMLSVGVTIGLAVLAILIAILWVINRKAADSAIASIRESVFMPMLYLGGALVTLMVVAAPQMPAEEMLASLKRVGAVGTTERTLTVDPNTEDATVSVNLVGEEVTSYEILSDQDIRVAAEEKSSYSNPIALVQGDEPYQWNVKSKLSRGLVGEVPTIYLTNDSDAPAEVTLTFQSDVEMPEVHRVPIIAAVIVGMVVFHLLVLWLFPNVSNIATATAKEAISQPMFLLFTVGGTIALVAFIYIPYNTFGEDVKMLKDSGLSLIMIFSIIFAVWTASVTIADEIEGKTALTLLSKPISRRQFILGKYLGIILPVLLIFVLLGVVLMGCVSYKVVYDARETSNPTPDWQLCFNEMISTSPGLVLGFFETILLAAISVAISTRLPMLPNLIICGSVYVLGHLTPLIVQSGVGKNEFVAFFGQLVSTIMPMLDHLNIQAAIAAGQPVPYAYLGWAGLYTLIYVAVAMLFALILFEDRDLA